jgi:hypothetical protein
MNPAVFFTEPHYEGYPAILSACRPSISTCFG